MNQRPLIVPQVFQGNSEEFQKNLVRFLEQLIAQIPLEQGVSGSFTTADSKTVTVVNGIITKIA